MTFRARPTTRTGRRSGYESDHRRNLYFTLGFGAVVILAVLLLVGAGVASWYDEHLAPVAKVNGETITKDALRERVALETFRLDTLQTQTSDKVNAGHMSAAQGTQLVNYIDQQRQQIDSLAYEREIDTTLLLQLGPKQGVQVSPAEVDAQITKDATIPESRHTYQIQVKPETSTGATEPTQVQKDAAKKKADGLLADLKSGTSWDDVVKASGDADAAETKGDLYFLEKGTTSPDKAFVDAIFALAAAPGYTEVVEGADGVYRIGRMTEISAELVDPNFMQRATSAGVNEAAYRRADEAIVARDKIDAQLVAEVVDKPSEQRRTFELALENNGGDPITPGSVLVKHILYSPKDDPQGAAALAADDPAWKAAQDEANKAYAELKAGTKRFVDLAPASDDSSSGAKNGFLPYFPKGDSQLDPAFAAAISADGLQPGQLLAPVKSAFGWHVIEFVTTDDPTVRSQKLSTEFAKSGTDRAKLVAENSIAASAAKGGELGWVARYQLAKDAEDAIFATQANGLSTGIQGDGLTFYQVAEIATRLPDPAQATTLRDNVFANWYQGVKGDKTQTTIERLISPTGA
jgi:parvulin-like peptidyl-prolyl isomerase